MIYNSLNFKERVGLLLRDCFFCCIGYVGVCLFLLCCCVVCCVLILVVEFVDCFPVRLGCAGLGCWLF